MSTVSFTVAPLSDFGANIRKRNRELGERLGISTKPLNIVGPDLAAPIVYGRALVNGRLVFAHRPGNTVVSHLVMVYGVHEINAFEDVLYSGRTLVRSAGKVVDFDPAFGWIETFEHLGTDTQTADQTLINEVGTDIWTTAHRLLGLPYIYFQTALTAAKFATESPEAFQAIVQGAKVLDTRTDIVGFSKNPALCLRDYLTNTVYGLGIPATDMDDTAFDQAANDCDTQSFTIGAVIDTASEPFDVIERIVDAMGGTLQRVNGLFAPKVGIFEAATVTLGEDDLVVGREPTIIPKSRGGVLVNGMRGVFIEPARGFQETDIPPVIDPTFVTEDGGFEHLGDKSLPVVTDVNQAQHLLSIELLRGRRQVIVAAGFKLVATQVRAGDIMALNYSRNGIAFVAKLFLVETLALSVQGTELSVELDLREIDAAVFTAPSFTALPALAEIIIFQTENLEPAIEEELRIAGLELFNATELNGTEFTDDDAIFTWRTVSSSTGFEFGAEPAGAGSGAPGKDFRDFFVRILNLDDTVRREMSTTVERFDYTLEMNQTDGTGTPATDFVCEVTIRTFSGDRDAVPQTQIASNPELGRDDFDPIDEVSGSFAWDVGVRPKRTIRLVGNATILNMTNAKEGATYLLIIQQRADIGPFTLAFGNEYLWPGGIVPTITASQNAEDIITFLVKGGLPRGVHQGDFK